MRDGMPTIALVVAAIALIVALAGAISPAGSETTSAPDELLKAATKRLDLVEKNRASMRQKIAELNDDIIEIKEASAGARGEAFDKIEIQNAVRKLVEEELAKRVVTQAKAVGAKVNGQETGKVSPQMAQFNKMISNLKTQVRISDAKTNLVRQILSKLRSDLNLAYRDAATKKITVAVREQRAAAARKNTLDRIGKVLTQEEMARFQNWRTTADEYTKRLFGG